MTQFMPPTWHWTVHTGGLVVDPQDIFQWPLLVLGGQSAWIKMQLQECKGLVSGACALLFFRTILPFHTARCHTDGDKKESLWKDRTSRLKHLFTPALAGTIRPPTHSPLINLRCTCCVKEKLRRKHFRWERVVRDESPLWLSRHLGRTFKWWATKSHYRSFLLAHLKIVTTGTCAQTSRLPSRCFFCRCPRNQDPQVELDPKDWCTIFVPLILICKYRCPWYLTLVQNTPFGYFWKV